MSFTQFWFLKDYLYKGAWSISWENVPHILDADHQKKVIQLTAYSSSFSFLGSLQIGGESKLLSRWIFMLFAPGFLFPKFFMPIPTHKYKVCSSGDPATCFSFKEEFLICNGAVVSSHSWSHIPSYATECNLSLDQNTNPFYSVTGHVLFQLHWTPAFCAQDWWIPVCVTGKKFEHPVPS